MSHSWHICFVGSTIVPIRFVKVDRVRPAPFLQPVRRLRRVPWTRQELFPTPPCDTRETRSVHLGTSTSTFHHKSIVGGTDSDGIRCTYTFPEVNGAVSFSRLVVASAKVKFSDSCAN